MRAPFTVSDFGTAIGRVGNPILGRLSGVFYGFFLSPFLGPFWGWRWLRIHPRALFLIEKGAVIDLKGVLHVGFFRKHDVPMPGKRRTGLVVKKGGIFRSGNQVHLTTGSSVHVSSNAIVEIGDHTFISYDSVVVAREKISIGSHCAISWGVSILDSPLHKLADVPYTQPIKIGSKVWTGHSVSVLQGVTIGDGAVIGANSLVNRDIPPRSLAVGSPARVIRENIVWEI